MGAMITQQQTKSDPTTYKYTKCQKAAPVGYNCVKV